MRYADPLDRARELERLHNAAFSGDDVIDQLRPVIWESWRRSLDARIDPDRCEPSSSLVDTELRERQGAHLLAPLLPMLRETLLGAADEASHVMILTDGDGHILWREGSPQVQREADAVSLSEGARWSEESIGTNAMGTALASGMPVQIHSAEHLVRTYHSWTCAASPVRDPDTSRVIGTLDISGPLGTMHPALLSLVTATSRLVESQLRLHMAARDDALLTRNAHHLALLPDGPAALLSSSGRVIKSQPATWLETGRRVAVPRQGGRVVLPGGASAVVEPVAGGFLLRVPRRIAHPEVRSQLSLSLLGDAVPAAWVDGCKQELTLRHAEILALLSMHPNGLTAEKLALLLHGEHGNATTVRVEIHRLRNSLGHNVVRTKPYRITADVTSDFGTVCEALRRGEVSKAVEHYRGSVLPRSESPKIREEREDLHASFRRSVLASRDPEHLWQFSLTEEGQDDVEVLGELQALLPDNSPRAGTVDARLQRLLAEET